MAPRVKWHVNGKNEVGRCSATAGNCPFGTEDHFSTKKAAEMEGSSREVVKQGGALAGATRTRGSSGPLGAEGWSLENFYGELPPRAIQLEAMTATAAALQEEDSTQLVAACGTGKTYMARQLLRHTMDQEGANGVAVVLTSSIKLATDTADDMRPGQGGYDRALGEYDKDYVVIEVHSGDSARNFKTAGAVDTEKIRQAMEEAQAAGKKVVIVSTYDSSRKVLEAQQALQDPSRGVADIIMHDEAHNILGQQRPTTVSEQDGPANAYTGFHNEIPGAIQARKRLYATATPVIAESPSDKETHGDDLEAAKRAARALLGDPEEGVKPDPWSRVTYYSDDALVGKISGYISQEDAIEAGCLARPEYSIRGSEIQGDTAAFANPVVTPQGTLREGDPNDPRELTPQTYGAVRATLEALVADAPPGGNGATNALAYVGAIGQAEGFKEHFAEVAHHQSGDMALDQAERLAHSPNPEERRAARMRLLAEHAEVRAAHSRSDRESKQEREAAFKMFRGADAKEGEGWSPRRRVLANVDIFSEGVSIPEIDTVVLSDDSKLSERAMTQAIGRSIRTVGGNAYKNTGHVVIPSVTDSRGVHLTEASVNLAAYGATRVERGVATAAVRGEKVRPDEKTRVRRYSSSGELLGEEKALAITQQAVPSVLPLVAAAEMEAAHSYLVQQKDHPYNKPGLSTREKSVHLKTRLEEKLSDRKTPKDDRPRLRQVLDHVNSISPQELRNLRRDGRVVTSALGARDMGALSPAVRDALISSKTMSTTEAVSQVTRAEKQEALQGHVTELAALLAFPPGEDNEAHRRVHEALPPAWREISAQHPKGKIFPGMAGRLAVAGMARGQAPRTPALQAQVQELHSSLKSFMDTEEGAALTYEFFEKATPKNTPLLAGFTLDRRTAFENTRAAKEAARAARQVQDAAAGEQSYALKEGAMRKDGSLTSATLRHLMNVANQESWRNV